MTKKLTLIFQLFIWMAPIIVTAQKVSTSIFYEPYIATPKYFQQQPIVFYDSEFRAYKDLPFVFLFNEIVSEYIGVYGPAYVNASDFSDTNYIETATFYPFFTESIIDKSFLTGSSQHQSRLVFWIDTLIDEQVFKIGWNNMGFKNCTANDSLNMQIWFFERSHKVQFRYGKSNLTNPNCLMQTDTPFIAFYVEKINGDYYGAYNGSNDIYTYTFMDPTCRIVGIPKEGTVIEFIAEDNFLNTNAIKLDKKLYLLQNKNTLKVKFKQREIEILKLELLNLNARKILETKEAELDVSNVASGMYIVKVYTNSGIYTQKFLK